MKRGDAALMACFGHFTAQFSSFYVVPNHSKALYIVK